MASALAGAFGCSMIVLSLTIVLSWFGQQAVSVLLTLLALGAKGIRIGPSAPASASPGIFSVRQQFDLRLVGRDPAADPRETLAPQTA